MPRTPPYHVVVDVTGRFALPSPGILTAWRQREGHWEAYVISAERYRTGAGEDVLVRQGWHRVEHVRPVQTPEIDG